VITEVLAGKSDSTGWRAVLDSHLRILIQIDAKRYHEAFRALDHCLVRSFMPLLEMALEPVFKLLLRQLSLLSYLVCRSAPSTLWLLLCFGVAH
jgi:hypothetical protein